LAPLKDRFWPMLLKNSAKKTLLLGEIDEVMGSASVIFSIFAV
jgi:hypothetical protein